MPSGKLRTSVTPDRTTEQRPALGHNTYIIWSIITALILMVVFEQVVQLLSGGVPYAVLALSGMLAGRLFSTGLMTPSGEPKKEHRKVMIQND